MMAETMLSLGWFFGTGAATALGDHGLRSPIGGQLEAAEQGFSSSGGVGMAIDGRLAAFGFQEVTSLEHEAMARRMGHVERWRRVRDRLAALAPVHQTVLRLHFGERELARGMTAAAKVSPEAERRFRRGTLGTGPARAPGELSTWLAAMGPGGARAAVVADADAMVAEAVAAYEAVGRG